MAVLETTEERSRKRGIRKMLNSIFGRINQGGIKRRHKWIFVGVYF